MPKTESDSWMKKYNCVVLKWKSRLHDLYDAIGIKEITKDKIYIQYILPYFHSFSEPTQLEHLINLRENFDLRENEPLTLELNNLDFIPDPQGSTSMFSASRFYDSDNEIFRAILPDESFPPPPFHDNEWLHFLKLIGLHKDVSQQDFIRFANQVVKTKYTNNELALSQSKMLIKFMMCSKHFHDVPFLRKVSHIKFVPVESVDMNLLAIHPYQATEDFTYFSNFISLKYASLVWTVSPLLPEWADPNT
ncbi:sacsin-like, partial [Saccoglossus kowalevskii]